MLRTILSVASTALLAGCLDEPPYACQRSEQCLLEGYIGTCDVASGRCVYPAAECRGMQSIQGFTDGRGNCVAAPNDQGEASTTASSSTSAGPTAETTDAGTTVQIGTTAESTSGGTTAEPETSGEATTSDTTPAGSSESSGGSSSSTGGTSCDSPIGDITGYGGVSASSALNGFGPGRATDDDNTTSWMGTTGTNRQFRWTSEDGADRCFQRIEIDDNSMHANAKFQSGYGFEQAVVRVMQADMVAFEEVVQLPGSPDGNWSVEIGGVIGTRVVVEVGPFENEFAGGFSEFRVFGNPL